MVVMIGLASCADAESTQADAAAGDALEWGTLSGLEIDYGSSNFETECRSHAQR